MPCLLPHHPGDRNDHGRVDGHELIGRRVELRSSDRRDAQRSRSGLGRRTITSCRSRTRRATARRPVREGEAVTILGTVLEMPNARQRLSWGLTAPDLVQLTDQRSTSAPTASGSTGVKPTKTARVAVCRGHNLDILAPAPRADAPKSSILTPFRLRLGFGETRRGAARGGGSSNPGG